MPLNPFAAGRCALLCSLLTLLPLGTHLAAWTWRDEAGVVTDGGSVEHVNGEEVDRGEGECDHGGPAVCDAGVEFGGEPEFADVEGGETTKFTLTPRALGGVTETPTVQATGLPAGVTATMGGMMAFGTGTALTALAVTPGAMDVVRGGSGPVTVVAEGLSTGLTATPLTIASGATTGNPVFVATAGAPGGRGR